MTKVPVREGLVALLAFEWLVAGVELLDVETKVGFSAAGRRTQLALVHRLLTYVNRRISHLNSSTYYSSSQIPICIVL